MNGVVVDTNVVLSFLTDRDPGQQRAAAKLFGQVATADVQIVVPQVVLTEIVYVLVNLYKISEEEVAGLLRELLTLPHVMAENHVSWSKVLATWPDRVPDFADAVLVTVARAGGHSVASFDRKLTRGLGRLGVSVHPLR